LLNDLLDLVDSSLDSFRISGCNISMKRFIFTRQGLTIFSPNFSLFHTSFSSDDDLGSCVLFHVLEGIASGSNQQSNKVDVRMIILRNHNFITHFYLRSLVIWWRLVLGVDDHHPLDALVPHLLQLLPLPVLPRVQPLAVGGVDRLGGGRPILRVDWNTKISTPQSSTCLFNFELQ